MRIRKSDDKPCVAVAYIRLGSLFAKHEKIISLVQNPISVKPKALPHVSILQYSIIMSQPNNVMISVQQVCKRFKEVQAVDHLDLEIRNGEYVALLGPNGVGKTTLVEMIEGLQQPRW